MPVSAHRAFHPFQEDGAHDADEGPVPLLHLRFAASRVQFDAIRLQVVDREIQILDRFDDLLVDRSVQIAQAIRHRLRNLVPGELHRLATQLHRLPCFLQRADIVPRAPHQRKQHGIQQARAPAALLDGAECVAQIGDRPAPRIPGVVPSRDQAQLVIQIPGRVVDRGRGQQQHPFVRFGAAPDDLHRRLIAFRFRIAEVVRFVDQHHIEILQIPQPLPPFGPVTRQFQFLLIRSSTSIGSDSMLIASPLTL